GSASDLGLGLFARILGQVLLFLAGGVWADRFPRQHVMVASNVVRFFSQGLLGLLLVSGHAEIWQLVALQLVHGAATGVFRPAASGLTPQRVPPAQLQAANGLMYLTLPIGGLPGLAAGAWAVILVAFSFGTLLGNMWAIRVRPRRPLVFAWSVILLCGPSLVLLAFRAPAWTIALTEMASGLAIGVAGTVWETTLQRN